jgi:pentapeptide repeat protein
MANEEHLKILKQGAEQWNKWRVENAISPDLDKAFLSDANLSRAYLEGANLNGAKLFQANLSGAKLNDADLSDANLLDAKLSGANLFDAKLSGANLNGANLNGADPSNAILRGADVADVDLQSANLTSADVTDADLSRTNLVETDFTNATITGCRTYGASAWNVTLVGTVQHNLVITKQGEPVVTVDDLEVGQFIYLILNNTKIRNVIDTITSKGVLILGRFSDPQRKSVLDGLREACGTSVCCLSYSTLIAPPIRTIPRRCRHWRE